MATVNKAKKIVRSYTLSLERADHTTAIAQIVLQTAMVTWSASWHGGLETSLLMMHYSTPMT